MNLFLFSRYNFNKNFYKTYLHIPISYDLIDNVLHLLLKYYVFVFLKTDYLEFCLPTHTHTHKHWVDISIYDDNFDDDNDSSGSGQTFSFHD